jgi:hypothetical protein
VTTDAAPDEVVERLGDPLLALARRLRESMHEV